MTSIKDLPLGLRTDARRLSHRDFTGHLSARDNNILETSAGVPIREVKINDNVAVLEPGEAALSGKFAFCSAAIAKKGNRLYVMHIYPGGGWALVDGLIQSMENQGFINTRKRKKEDRELFDNIILIGKAATAHLERFAKICHNNPQIISLDADPRDPVKKGFFNLLVYNDPQHPGDLSSFDLWFDEDK